MSTEGTEEQMAEIEKEREAALERAAPVSSPVKCGHGFITIETVGKDGWVEAYAPPACSMCGGKLISRFKPGGETPPVHLRETVTFTACTKTPGCLCIEGHEAPCLVEGA